MRLLLLLALTLPARAQLVGNIMDAPQHLFTVGGGVGPTNRDWSAHGGIGEKISAQTGTYSYTGTDFVPALITLPNGARAISVTIIVHTGLKQILFQRDRFTFVVDGSAGTSLPSSQNPSYNFSVIGAVDFVWRLNKTLRTTKGEGNSYLALEQRFTQLTGAPGQTVVSLGIAWVHSVN